MTLTYFVNIFTKVMIHFPPRGLITFVSISLREISILQFSFIQETVHCKDRAQFLINDFLSSVDNLLDEGDCRYLYQEDVFFLSHYNTFNVPYGILLIHPFYLSSIEATTLIKIYLSYKKYA